MRRILVGLLAVMVGLGCWAQEPVSEVGTEFAISSDSVFALSSDAAVQRTLSKADSLLADTVSGDTLKSQFSMLNVQPPKSKRRDWSTWRPEPQRALWLALVIPGGGQIYNRKYWKLPLVYGGFMGCAYALTWNNTMYKDYSQAYLDIMDDDPGTASYNSFMHLGRTVTDSNLEYYQTLFKKRRDRYRRYRDMSFFVLIGIYALSVIDAYVDAELSVFDISSDLSLKVEPAVISRDPTSRNPLYASSVGVNCSLNF